MLDALLTDPLLLLKLLGVGLLAGAASGMLGIGGGVVMVPALVFLTPPDFNEAVAASLLVMVVATPVGLLRHGKAGNVRLRHGIILGVSGFAGVLLGAWLGRHLTQSHLMQLFALLLVLSARQLVYGRPPRRLVRSAWPLVVFGVAAGLVAKLLGVGGGIIMVPGLVFLGLGMHTAVATSLAAVWTNATLSTLLNLFDDTSWWIFAVPLAAGSLLGVRAGAVRALRTRADPLRRLFALLLVYTALAMVSRSLG